jgi:transcriptional regulator with XRE-family HTH domain
LRPRSKYLQPTDLSIAIRELRTALGMTQDAFAAQLGTTLTSVARYETNARIPRAQTLLKLAKLAEKAGKTDLASLFRRTFAVEFRDVTRKGYEAVIAAPLKEAIGLRNASTSDLAKVKALLIEMWKLSSAFERPGLTLPAASRTGREIRLRLRDVAELLLEDGVLPS